MARKAALEADRGPRHHGLPLRLGGRAAAADAPQGRNQHPRAFRRPRLPPRPFSVTSRWFEGAGEIPTYELDELLGTKLRALYQRRRFIKRSQRFLYSNSS